MYLIAWRSLHSRVASCHRAPPPSPCRYHESNDARRSHICPRIYQPQDRVPGPPMRLAHYLYEHRHSNTAFSVSLCLDRAGSFLWLTIAVTFRINKESKQFHMTPEAPLLEPANNATGRTRGCMTVWNARFATQYVYPPPTLFALCTNDELSFDRRTLRHRLDSGVRTLSTPNCVRRSLTHTDIYPFVQHA